MKPSVAILGLTMLTATCGYDKWPSSEPVGTSSSEAGCSSASETTATAATSSAAIAREEASGDCPVVAAATLRPTPVRPGQTVTLVVQVRTAPGWHIYAAESGSGPVIPTSLTLKLPAGWTATGKWVLPEAVPNLNGPGQIYQGIFAFRRPLTVSGQPAPGAVEVACELRYQVCNAFVCRPPASLTARTRAEIIASP